MEREWTELDEARYHVERYAQALSLLGEARETLRKVSHANEQSYDRGEATLQRIEEFLK